MRFDLEAVPQYWHSGSPFLTHYFTAGSLLFPGGERFFIQSVRDFQEEIDALGDRRLGEQVAAFVAQEAQHSHQHRAYDRWMARSGLPVERYERRMEQLLQWVRRWLPRKAQLALTVSLEHMTAVFAHVLLSEPRFSEGMHPTARDLWLWHAVEETEHKAVAFDVYQKVCGSYWLRVLMMVRTTLGFPLGVGVFQLLLLARDGTLWDLRDVSRGLRFLWGRGGFMRAAWPELRRFYRRDFHPWQLDNRDRIRTWQAQRASCTAGGGAHAAGVALRATSGETPIAWPRASRSS